MKKLLIAFGCSWTDGDVNCFGNAWPEKLSNSLEMECINLGKAGSGNERIHNLIIEKISMTPKEQIGYVVIMWSGFNRWDFHNDTIFIPCSPKQIQSEQRVEIANVIMKHGYQSYEHQLKKTIIYMVSIQNFLKSKNIPFLQGFSFFSNHPQEKKDSIKYLLEYDLFYELDTSNSIGFPYCNLVGGSTLRDLLDNEHLLGDDLLGVHPNDKGHELISDYIKEIIND